MVFTVLFDGRKNCAVPEIEKSPFKYHVPNPPDPAQRLNLLLLEMIIFPLTVVLYWRLHRWNR